MYSEFSRYTGDHPYYEIFIPDDSQTDMILNGFLSGDYERLRVGSRQGGKMKRFNTWFYDREDSSNLLQKWLSICVNIDYDEGYIQSWINGERLEQHNNTLEYPNTNSMTVRLAKYYADGAPLIGKIVDFNMWDKVLSEEEMSSYTKCNPHHAQIPIVGNLINPSTQWDISGTLIERVDVPEEEIACLNRTVFIPIRYQKMEEAMEICEILGEEGDYLKPFDNFDEYKKLYKYFKSDPTMLKHCAHGGRHFFWLPYQENTPREAGEPSNVTFYKSNQQLTMNDAWRPNNGPLKSTKQINPCVMARMEYDVDESWQNKACEMDSLNYDSWGCTACTFPLHFKKNNLFHLRGLCFRTGFDQEYMIRNNKETGKR